MVDFRETRQLADGMAQHYREMRSDFEAEKFLPLYQLAIKIHLAAIQASIDRHFLLQCDCTVGPNDNWTWADDCAMGKGLT